MEGAFENHLNGKLFYETLARILGEQYCAKITVTVIRKEEPDGSRERESA